MPASLPGETRTNNLANPSLGKFVIFDPLSGPKGSPLDAKIATGTYDANRVPIKTADPTNLSTGQLSTGIGMSPGNALIPNGDVGIAAKGFNDNMVPGKRILTYAAAPAKYTVATDSFDSTMLYIGGGRMIAGSATDKAQARPFVVSPYTAGIALFGAGQGGSRDAGAGPAFTGFPMKMTTAAGAVAIGGAVETGFTNRTGLAMVAGQSTFASDAAASVAPTLAETPPGEQPSPPPPAPPPPPQMPTTYTPYSASRV